MAKYILASHSTLYLKSPRQQDACAGKRRCASHDRLSMIRAEVLCNNSHSLQQLHKQIKDALTKSAQAIATLAKDTKGTMVRAAVDALFMESSEVNMQFQGNYAPVDEIGDRVPVEVIEGAIPADFPAGVYIRNGPNPQFEGKHMTSPFFGNTIYHWFEGDGMLHATYFGSDGKVSYNNKYVETLGYKEEKKHGRQLWLSTLEGDPKAIAMGFFFNMMQFGKPVKPTCNTSVFYHAGILFANAEGDLPHEINVSNLSTTQVWHLGKQWGRPFSSHPKVVNDTKELIIFGMWPLKPYLMTGVVSSDGKEIIHKCDLELERNVFCHDIGITKNYNIVMDLPLVFDFIGLLRHGQSLLDFKEKTYARVGIMPRFGDAKSVRWFAVEMNSTFHVVNSYEEGDEVVLHGCRSRRPFFPSKLGMDKMEWYARGIKHTPLKKAQDRSVDGALFTKIHEWRFNLQTGVVVERDLTNAHAPMEMPKINEKFIGHKNEFAYAQLLDSEATSSTGLAKFGKLVKIHFREKMMPGETCSMEFYEPGSCIFVSEPLFVHRPFSLSEDDGWVITYVHDETNNTSEVHIIDAKKFSSPPLARIRLPQRVPYGFHSTFVYGLY